MIVRKQPSDFNFGGVGLPSLLANHQHSWLGYALTQPNVAKECVNFVAQYSHLRLGIVPQQCLAGTREKLGMQT